MYFFYISFLKVTVPINEIVDVTKITGRNDEGGFEVVGFTVTYITHEKNFLLKRALAQFLGSPEEGEEWSAKIQEAIDKGTSIYFFNSDRSKVVLYILLI